MLTSLHLLQLELELELELNPWSHYLQSRSLYFASESFEHCTLYQTQDHQPSTISERLRAIGAQSHLPLAPSCITDIFEMAGASGCPVAPASFWPLAGAQSHLPFSILSPYRSNIEGERPVQQVQRSF